MRDILLAGFCSTLGTGGRRVRIGLEDLVLISRFSSLLAFLAECGASGGRSTAPLNCAVCPEGERARGGGGVQPPLDNMVHHQCM